MPSKRTVESRKRAAKKKAEKTLSMKTPGRESTYARKQRGVYGPSSPYRAGGAWEIYG